MLIADAARALVEIDWSRRQQKQSGTGAPDSVLPTQNNPTNAPTTNWTVALPANEAASSDPVQVNSMHAVAAPGMPDSSTDSAPPTITKISRRPRTNKSRRVYR